MGAPLGLIWLELLDPPVSILSYLRKGFCISGETAIAECMQSLGSYERRTDSVVVRGAGLAPLKEAVRSLLTSRTGAAWKVAALASSILLHQHG